MEATDPRQQLRAAVSALATRLLGSIQKDETGHNLAAFANVNRGEFGRMIEAIGEPLSRIPHNDQLGQINAAIHEFSETVFAGSEKVFDSLFDKSRDAESLSLRFDPRKLAALTEKCNQLCDGE